MDPNAVESGDSEHLAIQLRVGACPTSHQCGNTVEWPGPGISQKNKCSCMLVVVIPMGWVWVPAALA